MGGTGAYTGATGIAHENTIAANPLTGEFTFGYNLRFYVLHKITLPNLFLSAGVPPVNGACNPNSANPNQVSYDKDVPLCESFVGCARAINSLSNPQVSIAVSFVRE